VLCDRVAIVDAGEIVALGTIPEVVAKFAGKGVELEIVGDLEAAAALVRPHGAVTLEAKNVLRVEPTAALAPVIAALESGNFKIARIESREASLETAFLALTGRGLRDAS
jgi:ABC-2 type transport system ATP-binding protein